MLRLTLRDTLPRLPEFSFYLVVVIGQEMFHFDISDRFVPGLGARCP